MVSIERFHPYGLPRAWGEERIVADTPHYLGKVLIMQPGTQGGLQYHVEKDETFYLISGEARVECEAVRNSAGELELITIPMYAGESYHIPPGAVHRVTAVTQCVFFETSTRHFDDRVHVEAQYGQPETGGLPTTR